MPLSISDQDDLRSATRDVLEALCTSEKVRARTESPGKFDAELWKRGVDLGWNALAVPEQYDGLGLSVAEACIVAEEFGRVGQASPLPATLGVAFVVSEFGSERVKTQWLPRVAAGAALSWASGRGTARPSSSLTLRESEDGFVLDGAIEWLPDGPTAAGFLVPARLGTRDVAVMLDATDPGVDVGPMQSLDIGRLHGRLSCTGVAIGAPAVLHEGAAEALFDVAVALQCAETVGLSNALLSMTIAYVQSRVQFGRPIGSFQALKHRIADMLVLCEAARATTSEAAALLADSIGGASEAVSVAKSTTGRAGNCVASEALQLHGGIGFTWEHDLHIFLRRAKVNELLLGTPEWHDDRLTAFVLARIGSEAS
ncbi:acyl-CoA dehydrogenase family protein [Nocardia alni]|uniref:acyl-CoA dehydrogenase family protein n=1 Tax=Nocardia alni TaxID=2815723 RepID=UPI001C220D8C|nr:acyl-CoA dehydrogenase family protein [Nocardia alni]